MAGQLPFLNTSGVNLLPLLGKPLGNPQQFFNQINSLRMPRPNTSQESFGQESNRRQRMQFSDDHYNREPPDIRGDGPFREPYNRLRRNRSQEEDSYAGENRERICGLMDKEIPVDFLFPEMGTDRYNEKQRRDDFERRNHGASTTRQTPIRPSSELRDQEGSPRESKYGFRNDAVPNCYLVPPLDDTYVLALSEKQPGCRTVFIGGLPSMADEDIIREIFGVCGAIEKITINSARANNQVKHCQLQFVQYDSLERAVKFNGHVLVIGDGHDVKTKIGRIRVDYDKLPSKDISETDSNVANKQLLRDGKIFLSKKKYKDTQKKVGFTTRYCNFLITLYELFEEYPRLCYCAVSIRAFMSNMKIIREICEEDETFWKNIS